MEKTPRKLLDQVSDAIRVKHYSLRTQLLLTGYDIRTMQDLLGHKALL